MKRIILRRSWGIGGGGGRGGWTGGIVDLLSFEAAAISSFESTLVFIYIYYVYLKHILNLSEKQTNSTF